MKKLPTALELWDKASNEISSVDEINYGVPLLMKEFAALHVRAALEAVNNKYGKERIFPCPSKQEILESYPLKNIL